MGQDLIGEFSLEDPQEEGKESDATDNAHTWPASPKRSFCLFFQISEMRDFDSPKKKKYEILCNFLDTNVIKTQRGLTCAADQKTRSLLRPPEKEQIGIRMVYETKTRFSFVFVITLKPPANSSPFR